MGRVLMLPGTVMTPEVFVERLREHAGKIAHIACVVQWKETESGEPTNATGVYSTQMPMGDAAWLRYVFDQDFPNESAGEPAAPHDPGR